MPLESLTHTVPCALSCRIPLLVRDVPAPGISPGALGVLRKHPVDHSFLTSTTWCIAVLI